MILEHLSRLFHLWAERTRAPSSAVEEGDFSFLLRVHKISAINKQSGQNTNEY